VVPCPARFVPTHWHRTQRCFQPSLWHPEIEQSHLWHGGQSTQPIVPQAHTTLGLCVRRCTFLLPFLLQLHRLLFVLPTLSYFAHLQWSTYRVPDQRSALRPLICSTASFPFSIAPPHSYRPVISLFFIKTHYLCCDDVGLILKLALHAIKWAIFRNKGSG